jgi:hypothetical protein
MKRLLITILLIGCLFKLTNAQEKAKRHYSFSSVNCLAFPAGNNSFSIGLQTINGIRKDKWTAGLGIGLDYYLYRTIPLFADVRREFGEKQNKWLMYGDAGINVPWVVKWYVGEGDHYRAGLYSDVGIGYSLGFKKDRGAIFTIGHSLKYLQKTTTYTDWRGKLQTDLSKYHFSRIIIKMGWKF